MTDKATQVITDAMRAQGAHYPQAGALLIRAALATARLELIELPEVREDETGAKFADVDVPAEHGPGAKYAKVMVADSPWGVELHCHCVPDKPNPATARSLAAALLAAAHAAETQPDA